MFVAGLKSKLKKNPRKVVRAVARANRNLSRSDSLETTLHMIEISPRINSSLFATERNDSAILICDYLSLHDEIRYFTIRVAMKQKCVSVCRTQANLEKYR